MGHKIEFWGLKKWYQGRNLYLKYDFSMSHGDQNLKNPQMIMELILSPINKHFVCAKFNTTTVHQKLSWWMGVVEFYTDLLSLK